jgi:hypothetical protein
MQILVSIGILVSLASDLEARDFSCDTVGSTSVTWEHDKKKWETSGDVVSEVNEKYSLKLINAGPNVSATKKPALVGNLGASELVLFENGPEKFVYMESTSNGNILIWTLIPSKKNGTPQYDTLILNKAYVMFGSPVSYTSVYKCR